MHTHGVAADVTPDGAIPFRWAAFFGEAGRTYPPAEEWNTRVVGELRALRSWALDNRRPRSVLLTGSRRLSTSVAIGSVLSAVSGFRIEMSHRGQIWRTDAHADARTPGYRWRDEFRPGAGGTGQLAVGIGIINDVGPEAWGWLDAAGMRDVPRLLLHSSDALTSDAHANRAVSTAKAVVQAAVGRTGAKVVHLFLATPAHFALFLGHRLNAIARVICHERMDGGYVSTCTMWDRA